jgi:RNA polymerase sigma factor (TIGR02999 family)
MNVSTNDPAALRAVYDELRTVARRMLRREPYQHTLESCELVNQAWARLLASEFREKSESAPAEVVALAVLNMRRELVDHARRRRAGKRPDPRGRIALEDAPFLSHQEPDTFLAIDDLIDQLESSPAIKSADRKAKVARYALYGGLSESEVSEALGLPKSTVGNDLRFVRAWLASRLGTATA